MKRKLIFSLLLTLCTLGVAAQSSMTDNQVMQFVVKEHEAGTSNAQIVTKLMQRGVDITQIRRVRNKYEREMKQQGSLGSVNEGKTGTRMRENNGKTREEYQEAAQNYSNYQIKDGNTTYPRTYDKTNVEYTDMENELGEIVPMDSTELLKKLLEERKAKKNKVFGRDIFNNKMLSFEPNMNIATPQNYRLGPGDAVIIDIYGASQKTVEATVSPDGEVTIEGFGR